MTASYGTKALSFKQRIEDALLKAAENVELCEDELPTDAAMGTSEPYPLCNKEIISSSISGIGMIGASGNNPRRLHAIAHLCRCLALSS